MNRQFMRAFRMLLLCAAVASCARVAPTTIGVQTNEEERVRRLAELELSVVKITSSAYYRTWYYPRPSSFRLPAATVPPPAEQKLTSNSVAGTGVVLLQNQREMVVLTCNHVLDFADTIRHYYLDENKRPTNHLRALSVRYRQDVFIFHRSGEWTVGELIANDRENDIALLKTSRSEQHLAEAPLPCPFGDAGSLKLGQEVYVLGFPKGFFAVTRGLVSPSRGKGRFMVDIAFNRGYSGGVVVRLDGAKRAMEYVGMATSAAYDSQYLLVPAAETVPPASESDVPYVGDVFVEELKLINYGITFVVTSNVVGDFLRTHEERLQRMGFPLTSLFRG
ncbi:MAG: serine protease [candidate division KSB1 bacterium]|nr:serine protease [candidate division KSB1 bacterium]